jgi:hypothetical protein
MRNASVVLALSAVVLATAGASAAAPPAHASAYHHCKGIKDAGPTGMDPADVKNLRGRKVSCKRARRVARQWLKPFGNGQEGRFTTFGPWKCSDTIDSHTRVRCKARGGKRVRFYLG